MCVEKGRVGEAEIIEQTLPRSSSDELVSSTKKPLPPPALQHPPCRDSAPLGTLVGRLHLSVSRPSEAAGILQSSCAHSWCRKSPRGTPGSEDAFPVLSRGQAHSVPWQELWDCSPWRAAFPFSPLLETVTRVTRSHTGSLVCFVPCSTILTI